MGDGKEFTAFLPVNCGFGGLHVVLGAGLDLDETQGVIVPANQVDFAATVGRTKIAGDHDVSASSKIEIGVFFATPSRAQVLRAIVRRQCATCDPVKDANRCVSEAAREHGMFVAPVSRRPDG